MHPSDESFYFETEEPPFRNGVRVDPYYGDVYPDIFPADASTEPPVVKTELCRNDAANLVPPGFPGVWRISVEIDCGKDLPAFVEETYRMPGRELIVALEAAPGTDFLEIGSISP
jgi:hypothetical protein